ncbi:MAG: hypothetical protein ACFE9S_09280 [Candidatus Hermodarchaeota archaeon]
MTSTNKKYYGFNPPGLIPELFAPKLIGADYHEHSAPTFSLDGTEIYWSRQYISDKERPQTIMMMKFVENNWTSPEIAPFSGKYHDGGPIFSFNEDLLYFYSMRPHLDRNINYNNLWAISRSNSTWGEPYKLPFLINTEKFQVTPTISQDDTLYYTSYNEKASRNMIFMFSKKKGNTWTKPQILSPNFNVRYQDWLPCIAPDNSFFIFSSLREPSEVFNLYLSNRKKDGTWGIPQYLNNQINTAASERFPGLTRDGKFLFFIRDSQIYWVSTEILKIYLD